MRKSIIKIYRGIKSLLPSLMEAEFGLAKDTREVFIGTAAGNLRVMTELDSLPAALDILPVGTVLPWDKYLAGTPALSSLFAQADGQIISNPASPYNGKRIRNLNGKTLIGIAVTAVDDTAKTFTVSLNDVSAFSVGDTLSFTTASVPNAVVKAVNYGTGEITVGDAFQWDIAGTFQSTGFSLAGADTVSVSGLPRFLKGTDSEGSQVNQLQQFSVSVSGFIGLTSGSGISSGAGSYDAYNVSPSASVYSASGLRSGSVTQPDSQNIVWVIKYR